MIAESTLIIGTIIITGFILGELVSKLKLPKITGYILAGVLLNPQVFHLIPKNFTKHTNIITNVSLSFITFSVGGTLLYSRIKSLGKGIIYITIFEAEITLMIVATMFALIIPLFVHGAGITFLSTFIPVGLLIGALASPTDPSAALAVTHQYNARGPVTSTMLGVAASDDALGLMNYSLVLVVTQMLIAHEPFNFTSGILAPILIVCGSVILGIVMGGILNFISRLILKETEGVLIVLISGLLCICFGIAKFAKLDELLSTMVMGIIVVNYNIKKERIFKILERYTEELIFVLFFTISGMLLNFSILSEALIFVLFFAVFRTVGKFLGTFIGAKIARSPSEIEKYTAGGLIPYGGIVVGMALMLKQYPVYDKISDIIISVIIGATIVHEFAGPIFAKVVLKKAKEIK